MTTNQQAAGHSLNSINDGQRTMKDEFEFRTTELGFVLGFQSADWRNVLEFWGIELGDVTELRTVKQWARDVLKFITVDWGNVLEYITVKLGDVLEFRYIALVMRVSFSPGMSVLKFDNISENISLSHIVK